MAKCLMGAGGGIPSSDRSKLIPENIRDKVTIAGVTGSLTPVENLKVLMTAFSVEGGNVMYQLMNGDGNGYTQYAYSQKPTGTVPGTVKMVNIIVLNSGNLCGHSAPGTYYTDHTNEYILGGLHGSFAVLGTLD